MAGGPSGNLGQLWFCQWFNTPAITFQSIDKCYPIRYHRGMSTMSLHSDFARELDAARKAAGMTIRELARQAKTSFPYVHRVIHGQVCPSLDAAERLAAAAGVKLNLEVKPNSTKTATSLWQKNGRGKKKS